MCKTGYSLEKITKDNNNVKKNTFKKIFFPHCCILFEILWFKFKVQNTLSEMEGRRKKEQEQHSELISGLQQQIQIMEKELQKSKQVSIDILSGEAQAI
jgi:hypothetical protein